MAPNQATTTSQRYLYSQDSGLSGSTLIRYRMGYTSLFTDHWYARETGRTSGGENGQDICVSADDSRLYTANGYPSSSGVRNDARAEGPLAATSYPQSTECSWNGLFAGGTFGSYSDPSAPGFPGEAQNFRRCWCAAVAMRLRATRCTSRRMRRAWSS